MSGGSPAADPPRYLFTYGTLAPGSPVPAAVALSAQARVIGAATVTGTLFRGGGWPAWHPAGAGPVHGTLWALPADGTICDALLATLDHYEGVVAGAPDRSLFVRERVAAHAGARAYSAWIYRYARPVSLLEAIPDGRWTP